MMLAYKQVRDVILVLSEISHEIGAPILAGRLTSVQSEFLRSSYQFKQSQGLQPPEGRAMIRQELHLFACHPALYLPSHG
jgi:hypothetical protein